MQNKKIHRLTLTALLTASAVALSFAESMLPAAAFLPPGAKLGLSNVVIMFSASSPGAADTVFIAVIKAFFALITRGPTAFFMSLAGGLLSAACLLIIFKGRKGFGYIGTGVASALCHNAGQLAVSFIIIQSKAVLGYAPVLIFMSIATGLLTGLLLRAAMPYLEKLSRFVKE